jgi:hypothetical protein
MAPRRGEERFGSEARELREWTLMKYHVGKEGEVMTIVIARSSIRVNSYDSRALFF